MSLLKTIVLNLVIIFASQLSFAADIQIKELQVNPVDFSRSTGLEVVPQMESDTEEYDFEYRWFLNTSELEFETSARIDGSLLTRDDYIAVIVTPVSRYNGERSQEFRSNALQVLNSAPVITSKPPAKISLNDYRYQVQANDVDGDSLTFRLEEEPEGMKIDKSTGLINWSYSDFPSGEYSILIIAEDDYGGRAEQRFEFFLSLSKD